MRGKVILAVGTIALVAALAYQAQESSPVLCQEDFPRLGEIVGYRSQAMEPSPEELETLPKDTIFDKRSYQDAAGNWFFVSLVIGGRSKSSLHRPEICIPSQGFQMTEPHTIRVGDVDWRRVTLSRGAAGSIGFSYTFYNQTGYHTSSHIARIFRDVWDRSVLNRIDRWAMLTVNSSCVDDRDISRFLQKLGGLVK